MIVGLVKTAIKTHTTPKLMLWDSTAMLSPLPSLNRYGPFAA